MSIVTYPLNGVTYNAEDAEGYLCTRTSGVFAANDQFVASVTGDREITISPGVAWIKNTDFSGKSIVSRAAVALNVPTADGANARIDRVVIRFSKAENASKILIKMGTPAASPQPPALDRTEMVYELGLYTIRVPAASLTIGEGDITNTMLDKSVCGLMEDAVTGLSTEQMNRQWQALVSTLAGALQDVQAGALLTRTVFRAVIPSGGWTVRIDDSAYINEIEVAGVLETDEGDADLDMSGATSETAGDLRNGWALIDDVETISGGIRAVCFSDVPAVDVPIVIEVIR